MIHPDTELRFISPEVGYGVVATAFIPKGTITWAFDPLDRIFTNDDIARLPSVFQQVVDRYSYRDHEGNHILCWDHSRFVNHSFNSNCISTAYNFELAIRDIYPGEELTDDYGYLNVAEPFECLPEAGTTRTKVMPDDLLYFYAEWDAKLLEAFKYYNKVSQPLAPLVERKYRQKVQLIAEGKAEMDSILNCYYNTSGSRNIAA
ncbi:MAG: SET domain-containing protein-lysine N-methyltransferase [Sphingobacteriales bacterium]|nr:MAG: SET domain-containing protein-lysine N-methyltransferase [Sphingobacteriales bacterium]